MHTVSKLTGERGGIMKRFGLIISIALGITVLFPIASHAASGTYAALGDSVAAGAGLSSGSDACDRSPQAYPYIVAQQTGLSLRHFACTGAKADEGIYGPQRLGGTELPAQLDQAFAQGTPSLITMTIGANDVRWTQFVRQCYYIRCGYSVDTARFKVYLADLKLELNTVMAKIRMLSSGNPPQVIVTSYYDPFSSKACSETAELTSREISWLDSRVSSLNNALRGVVNKYSFADYASVSFAGHELCAADSWVQGQASAAPFHPTAAGQQRIAEVVLKDYSSSSSQSEATKSYRERILDWSARQRR